MTKQKKNYAMIVICADGRIVKHIQNTEPTLEQMQADVGGYIELIPFFTRIRYETPAEGEVVYPHGIAYCNEYGKLKNMPFNRRATEMWKVQNTQQITDRLLGDILFICGTYEECTT